LQVQHHQLPFHGLVDPSWLAFLTFPDSSLTYLFLPNLALASLVSFVFLDKLNISWIKVVFFLFPLYKAVLFLDCQMVVPLLFRF
jgi:hypothetical protein